MTKQPAIIHVVPKAEYWIVSGVSDRGKTGTYEVVREMIPADTQDNQAVKYGIEIPSAPLIWAIADRAYDFRTQKPEAAETLKNFLRQGFRQYPNTSSRIAYNPSGTDEVTHNYGTSDQYSLSANVVGPDSWMENMSDKSVLESILGTSDTTKINKVSNWINGTNSRIWRLNSRPKQRDERVVRFVALDGRLDLGCSRLPRDVHPAFRVLKIE